MNKLHTASTNNNVPDIPKADFDKLPCDIKKHIYTEQFQYEIIYSEIRQILDNNNSHRLDNTDLVNYFTSKKIISDEKLIYYLRNKNNIFDSVYNSHYVRNTNEFILMDTLNSMCQSWLMYLYH